MGEYADDCIFSGYMDMAEDDDERYDDDPIDGATVRRSTSKPLRHSMGDIADDWDEVGIAAMCEDLPGWIEDPKTGVAVCPECESPYIERKGRYGAFMGCPNFPKCPGGRTFSKEKS